MFVFPFKMSQHQKNTIVVTPKTQKPEKFEVKAIKTKRSPKYTNSNEGEVVAIRGNSSANKAINVKRPVSIR